MLSISIPVELGPRYRVGSVAIEGNKVIRGDFLQSLVTLKKGPGLQHQEAQQVHRGDTEILRRHRLFLRPGRAQREPGPGQADRRSDHPYPGKRGRLPGQARVHRQHLHQGPCHPPRVVPARGPAPEHQRPGGFHQAHEAAGPGDRGKDARDQARSPGPPEDQHHRRGQGTEPADDQLQRRLQRLRGLVHRRRAIRPRTSWAWANRSP